MKKIISLLLVIALTAALSIAGTLAYLTDKDSEVNVFTVGDVDITLKETFEQGATLIPGMDIEKKPTITNDGKNTAWVWVEIAIPAVFDNEDASKNVIHFNYSKETVADGLWSWTDENGAYRVANKTVDGIEYAVYTVLYETVLESGQETAEPVITKVYLDDHVDIDSDGNWYHVVNGTGTEIKWNTNTNGNPQIIVEAFAIQADGFDTVEEAYAAYQAQWEAEV